MDPIRVRRVRSKRGPLTSPSSGQLGLYDRGFASADTSEMETERGLTRRLYGENGGQRQNSRSRSRQLLTPEGGPDSRPISKLREIGNE